MYIHSGMHWIGYDLTCADRIHIKPDKNILIYSLGFTHKMTRIRLYCGNVV